MWVELDIEKGGEQALIADFGGVHGKTGAMASTPLRERSSQPCGRRSSGASQTLPTTVRGTLRMSCFKRRR